LLKYLKVVKESEVNGSSRPNETQMIMLKDIKSNLLPNILLRKMALTTKQKNLFISFQERLTQNYHGFSNSL
jgi:hypothetical protein